MITVLAAIASLSTYSTVGDIPKLPLPLPVATQKASVAPKDAQVKKVDLQMADQDLGLILRLLSAQAKVGLVLLSAPELKVSTNLVGVPFIDALRHLCALGGLSYIKVGTTYVVAPKERLREAYLKEWLAAHPEDRDKPVVDPPKTEPVLVTEVYNSNYVSSTQLAQALTNVFGKEALAIVAGPVQQNPSVSSQQTSGSTGASANMLSTGEAGGEASGKMLVLRGERKIVAEALALAKQMDVSRPQVAIEVTIHDIADNALRELGISWNFGALNITESASSGLNLGSFSRTPLTFSGVIKALETADKAKLLASPNVSVLDGERAFILIGDRINFPVLVGFGTGNTPIFSKQEERVGIYMQVAASVSSDQNITLSLYPQVSNVTGFLEVNGASYPQISTREAQTTLRVKSGETIVMGGLLKSEETHQVEKVPILGDLPFLGELFRRRKTTRTASQVIISITPRVIQANES